jgi:hypothetical protein
MAKSNAERQALFRARQKAEQAAQQAAEPGRVAAATTEAEPDVMPNGQDQYVMPDGDAVPEQPGAEAVAIGAEVIRQLKRYGWALEAIVASGSLADARALARRALGLAEPTVAAPTPAPAVPAAAAAPATHCMKCGGTRFYVLHGERRCARCMPAGVPRGYWASHPAEAFA